MTASSMFALFIGMFIIYNSFAIAVTQRRGEIGILRALGATRGQIRTLFLGRERGRRADWLGGRRRTRARLRAHPHRRLRQHAGIHVRRCRKTCRRYPPIRGFLLFAMAMGTGTSIVAALVPARNAARIEPIQALQKGRYQVLGAGENRLRRNIALLAAALAVACLPLSAWRPALLRRHSAHSGRRVCCSRRSCLWNCPGSCGAP